MTPDDDATVGGATSPEWSWTYEGYDPEQERLREALCTLGNGYLATRGAAPEYWGANPPHYPGTYVAGCYNRLTSHVDGHPVENEDLVNLPNWLPVRFRIHSGDEPATGPWLTAESARLLHHAQTLDVRAGFLHRRMRLEDHEGRRVAVHQTRLVSMADPHMAALRTEITAENWHGQLEIDSGIDGDVRNAGVGRYRGLSAGHLADWRTGGRDGLLWLECRTNTSGVHVAMAARHEVTTAKAELSPPRAYRRTVTQRALCFVGRGNTVALEKAVAVHTSRDRAISEPLQAVLQRLRHAPRYAELAARHRSAWERLWRRAELAVPGEAGKILRLHLFHVLQTLSPHTAELDAGVPARGLHGEAYRGHVFWDELFVLPWLNLHFPEVSRSLLAYRHRRLPRAVQAAASAGRTGAMYPWQSASDGREESQTLHLNPESGRWVPDNSHLQHHVGLAVAYNVWQYGQVTGDTEFLHGAGAEMLLQIARFWVGAATWDAQYGRYRIRGVVGPDEYHDAYPGAIRPGIDDNAYTNVTASWAIARALDLLAELPAPRRRELSERLGLGPAEADLWREVSRKLYVPWQRGVISQFEGYGDLEELHWSDYRTRYGDIRRLDRILEAEGDTVNRYQASKQADVLMLGYLFPARRLATLFGDLGYRLDDDAWRDTIEYYLRRTSHGSTLSSLVHGWVLARSHRAESWRYCREALLSDVADIQGGTTGEGIHLGAMAGTLDLVQRGLTGLEAEGDALRLDPVTVPQLHRFETSLRFRGHWGLRLRVEDGALRIGVPDSAQAPVRVALGSRTVTVVPGGTYVLEALDDLAAGPIGYRPGPVAPPPGASGGGR